MSITIDQLKEIEIKIGKVVSAEPVEGSDKLLKLEVNFGSETRQIVSGIAKFYSHNDLTGKEFPFVVNLESRTIMGLESQGMILAIDPGDGTAVLLEPEKEVPPGSILK